MTVALTFALIGIAIYVPTNNAVALLSWSDKSILAGGGGLLSIAWWLLVGWKLYALGRDEIQPRRWRWRVLEMIQVLFYFLDFLSGIILHMSFLHLFSFYETQHHSIIAKAKKPYLASKIWGVVYLFLGVAILVLCGFQFGLNLPTLLVCVGFGFGPCSLDFFQEKLSPKRKRNNSARPSSKGRIQWSI